MRIRSSLALTALSLVASCGCAGTSTRPIAPRAPRSVEAGRNGAEVRPTFSRREVVFDLGPEELPDVELVRAMDAVLRKASMDGPSVARVPWDHKSTPKYLDLVSDRYGLTAVERSMLMKNGMVVLPRVTFPSFGYAMHEIHRQELPLYVTVDSLLQAVFRSHESIVVEVESLLAKRLGGWIERIQKALLDDARSRSPRYARESARDADLYLGVVRALLDEGKSEGKSGLGQDERIAALSAKARAASGIEAIELFGRPRNVDFSFYEPRGVYLKRVDLHPYFRAMVWLTRLELNIVSRGARSSAPALTTEETPREALLALVLADLVERAGVTTEIANVDAYRRKLAGKREDLSLSELSSIAKKRSLSLLDAKAAHDALRAEIGTTHVRTVNDHVMPAGTPAEALPVITTFFGTSVSSDARAVAALVPSDGPPRVPRGPELGYLYGADAAARYVNSPGSRASLGAARVELERELSSPSTDLRSTWTALVRSAVTPPVGVVPGFMDTASYADRRVSTAIAGYAQIHHAYVLHSAQIYDYAGCTIPDAYVEPAAGTYERTLTYAKRLEELAALLPAEDREVAEFVRGAASRLGRVADVLRIVVRDELAGRRVSDEALAFLRMVAEYVPPRIGYGVRSPGRYNGFYPYMHAAIAGSFENVPYVVDHFTSTRLGQIAFVGEGKPALGLFVVDSGGEPRVMVGPVSRAYDRVGPLAKRVGDDGTGGTDDRSEVPPIAPHERSYVAPLPTGPAVPDFKVFAKESRVQIVSKRTLRHLTLERLDAHGTMVSRIVVNEVRPVVNDSDDGEDIPFPVTAEGQDSSAVRIRLPSGEVYPLEAVTPADGP